VESLASFVHVRGTLFVDFGKNGGFCCYLEKRKNLLVFIN